jgi:hypothetical protein
MQSFSILEVETRPFLSNTGLLFYYQKDVDSTWELFQVECSLKAPHYR